MTADELQQANQELCKALAAAERRATEAECRAVQAEERLCGECGTAGEARMATLESANAALAHEVSARQCAEDALRYSQERLALALQAGNMGVFDWDMRTSEVHWTPEAEALYGLPPGSFSGTNEAWEQFVHPDDLPKALEQFERSVQGRNGGRALFRIIRPDGSIRWIEDFWKVLCDSEGEPARVVGVNVDVTERVQGEQERERLLEQLKDANAAKDQFLAVLSHELRNPLSSVLAGVEVLRRAIPAEPRAERTLAVIERSVRLQARMVSDLLDLSRIGRGMVNIQRAPLLLDTVVRLVVDTVQADAEQAGVTLRTVIQPGLWVCGDLDRLQQITMNLLSNAIKFTEAGGEVRLRLERGDGTARLVVEDTGVGIDPVLLPYLFDMFRQGTEGRARKQGLGIGLALVKALTEMHGGSVRAESEGQGKGSRFIVELPLTAAPGSGLEGGDGAEALTQPRLLLVDDNADAALLMQESLELEGYIVHAAASAEDALEILKHSRPDAIVADIGLPGMDGYEFLRRVRQMPGMSDVPAFAVTGLAAETDAARACEAGFTGHLAEPIDVVALNQRIRDALASGARR